MLYELIKLVGLGLVLLAVATIGGLPFTLYAELPLVLSPVVGASGMALVLKFHRYL